MLANLPPMLANMVTDIILPLMQHDLPKPAYQPAYQGCVISMLVGRAVLLSQEKALGSKEKADHTAMVLGLVGATVRFFPQAAPAAGLTVMMGSAIIGAVVKHCTKHSKSLKHLLH